MVAVLVGRSSGRVTSVSWKRKRGMVVASAAPVSEMENREGNVRDGNNGGDDGDDDDKGD